jgi:hypothetical protein
METQVHPHQVEIYRTMTPQQKYDVMKGLINSARTLKYAYFHSLNPGWTEEQLQKALHDWFLYARS